MKRWQCMFHGWIYDQAAEEGIAPGTPGEDIPKKRICPDCGVGESKFQKIEI